MTIQQKRRYIYINRELCNLMQSDVVLDELGKVFKKHFRSILYGDDDYNPARHEKALTVTQFAATAAHAALRSLAL